MNIHESESSHLNQLPQWMIKEIEMSLVLEVQIFSYKSRLRQVEKRRWKNHDEKQGVHTVSPHCLSAWWTERQLGYLVWHQRKACSSWLEQGKCVVTQMYKNKHSLITEHSKSINDKNTDCLGKWLLKMLVSCVNQDCDRYFNEFYASSLTMWIVQSYLTLSLLIFSRDFG